MLLDLEMPEMDGLETLNEIRRQWPRLPVIMYSSLTQRGARATLDALEIGSQRLRRPSRADGGPEEAVRYVRADLIPKIRALRRTAAPPHRPPAAVGDARGARGPTARSVGRVA